VIPNTIKDKTQQPPSSHPVATTKAARCPGECIDRASGRDGQGVQTLAKALQQPHNAPSAVLTLGPPAVVQFQDFPRRALGWPAGYTSPRLLPLGPYYMFWAPICDPHVLSRACKQKLEINRHSSCAARAFCDCPAIISHRPRSQNILKE
jgi:hypothetical protein